MSPAESDRSLYTNNMIDFLIAVLALLVTLGILVTFHEYGHFWVARRCGVKVLRFSVGFGNPLKRWLGRDGTEYVIAPIPLGGYVKMLGMEDTSLVDPASVPEEQRNTSFACKPLWQRSAIVAAGPGANLLLAFVIFWLVNVSFGITGVAPVVQEVRGDSPAQFAGLTAGDRILAVDGRETATWQEVNMQLLGRIGESGALNLRVAPASGVAGKDVNIPIESWLGDSAEPRPIADLGIVEWLIPPRIGLVETGAPAAAGGLREDDLVLAVNDEPVGDWSEWVDRIRASPELDLRVVVERAGANVELLLRPESSVGEDGATYGRIGAGVASVRPLDLLPAESLLEFRYGPLEAVAPALRETWEMSLFVLGSIQKMILGLISVEHISGPITIAQVAGETATIGLDTYLGFLALLSISIAILNLLPIPMLDGGHLFFFLVEAVIRRPLPEAVQAWSLRLGMAMVLGIMVLAFYNDFNRLL